MIRQYLLNYKQELMEKKIDIEKSLQKNELLIKENIEFIRLIEVSEDKGYESFFPQNHHNNLNEKKIKSLKEDQKNLEKKGSALKYEIENMNQKLNELNSVIKYVNQNLAQTENMEKRLQDNEIFRLKLLETQEYERQRIARELHDSTVQSLTHMIHKLEICEKLMDVDTNRCKLELHNLSKTVRDTIHDMREVIYNLRPMSLDDIGLDVTIERELNRLRKNSNIKINYETNGDSDGIRPVIALTMLRIIQEACNNTIKHAKANNIYITINFTKKNIEMKIKDDGCGFDLAETRKKSNSLENNFGLSMMDERVFLLSGTIRIESEKGKGTDIYITIPKKEEI